MPDDYQFLIHIEQGLAALSRVSSIEYVYNDRELVYQHDKVKLYHYKGNELNSALTPVLVVFATVNRPEILDLFPDQSFIGGLLKNGLDVYLLDWGYPTPDDAHISLSDYVTHYLAGCIHFIKASRQLKSINLLGICQGGLISLSYAALFADIKNLILISTPVDFQTEDNKVAKLLSRIDVQTLIDVMGNISGIWLTQFFISLRPFELIGKKYLRFVDNIEDEQSTHQFLRVEKWLNDAPDQTAASFKELVQDYYQQNKLLTGKIRFNGQNVTLANVNVPILNIMAEQDEIVPMSASCHLKDYVSSEDVTNATFPSGHIGIYISEKVGGNMSLAIAKWLATHQD